MGKCLHIYDPRSESLLEIFIWIFNHRLQHKVGKAQLFFSIDNFIFPAASAIIWSPVHSFSGKERHPQPFPFWHTHLCPWPFFHLVLKSTLCLGIHHTPTFSSSTVLPFFFFLESLFLAPLILLICLTVLPHRWLHLHKKRSRRLMWQQEQVA